MSVVFVINLITMKITKLVSLVYVDIPFVVIFWVDILNIILILKILKIALLKNSSVLSVRNNKIISTDIIFQRTMDGHIFLNIKRILNLKTKLKN